MADYGIKVAQLGFDVNTCADYQLLFSSRWPVLKIHSQGTFSVANGLLDTTITTHSLGYVPVFWIFVDSTKFGFAQGTMFGVGNSQLQGFQINSTELKYFGSIYGNPGSFTGYYYIFRQDMATTVNPSSISTTPSSQAVQHNYGFKIAKPGKSVDSTDPRDFVIHTSYRSPQIHMAAPITIPVGNLYTFYHNLGYVPLFFLYEKSGLTNYWYSAVSDQTIGVTIDATTFALIALAGSQFYYMVFKDPFLSI